MVLNVDRSRIIFFRKSRRKLVTSRTVFFTDQKLLGSQLGKYSSWNDVSIISSDPRKTCWILKGGWEEFVFKINWLLKTVVNSCKKGISLHFFKSVKFLKEGQITIFCILPRIDPLGTFNINNFLKIWRKTFFKVHIFSS